MTVEPYGDFLGDMGSQLQRDGVDTLSSVLIGFMLIGTLLAGGSDETETNSRPQHSAS
jgi:hypothetical protein